MNDAGEGRLLSLQNVCFFPPDISHLLNKHYMAQTNLLHKAWGNLFQKCKMLLLFSPACFCLMRSCADAILLVLSTCQAYKVVMARGCRASFPAVWCHDVLANDAV